MKETKLRTSRTKLRTFCGFFFLMRPFEPLNLQRGERKVPPSPCLAHTPSFGAESSSMLKRFNALKTRLLVQFGRGLREPAGQDGYSCQLLALLDQLADWVCRMHCQKALVCRSCGRSVASGFDRMAISLWTSLCPRSLLSRMGACLSAVTRLSCVARLFHCYAACCASGWLRGCSSQPDSSGSDRLQLRSWWFNHNFSRGAPPHC